MPERGALRALSRERDLPKIDWTYFIVLNFLSVEIQQNQVEEGDRESKLFMDVIRLEFKAVSRDKCG